MNALESCKQQYKYDLIGKICIISIYILPALFIFFGGIQKLGVALFFTGPFLFSSYGLVLLYKSKTKSDEYDWFGDWINRLSK